MVEFGLVLTEYRRIEYHVEKDSVHGVDIYWFNRAHPNAKDWKYWLTPYDYRDQPILINSRGKPFLEDQSIFFNRSHSANQVVLAISRRAPLGIDLEDRSRRRDAEGILKKFFHPHQLEIYQSLSNDKALDYFLKLWTFHESAVKAYGISAYDRSIVRDYSDEIKDRLETSEIQINAIPSPPSHVGALAISLRT